MKKSTVPINKGFYKYLYYSHYIIKEQVFARIKLDIRLISEIDQKPSLLKKNLII